MAIGLRFGHSIQYNPTNYIKMELLKNLKWPYLGEI